MPLIRLTVVVAVQAVALGLWIIAQAYADLPGLR